jgi:carbon-monoxide dehydrogenase medium subunit
MTLWKTYAQPTTVDEALQLLNTCEGQAAIIAGGTDLLLDMQQDRHPKVDLMVDVTSIDELSGIKKVEGMIHLGAGVTHREILDSLLLKKHAACLVEGCGLIGGPQVRNVATIGGNVAHALPAGDGTIALLALEAEAQLATLNGRTWHPLTEFFKGPGVPNFDRSKEILVGFRFPALRSHESSAFNRVMRPQGVAIAILNTAVWIRCEVNSFDAIRIAMGPGGPQPFRAIQTEAFLHGKTISDLTIQEASEILLDEISLRTSRHRATLEYRQHLAPTLLADTIQAALVSLECEKRN